MPETVVEPQTLPLPFDLAEPPVPEPEDVELDDELTEEDEGGA